MSPRSMASLSNSSSTKGLPSLRSRSRSRNSGLTSSLAKMARTMAETESAPNGSSSTNVAAAVRRQPWRIGASGWRRWSSSRRYVARIMARVERNRRARKSSSSRVEASAQWISSTTSSNPPSAASARNNWKTDSKSRSLPIGSSDVASPAEAAPNCGSIGARSPAAGPRCSTSSAAPTTATWLPRASTKGRYGRANSASLQPPHRTTAPSRSARSSNCRASRVLPRPASPASRASRPSPRRASSKVSSRASASRSRPTIVGQRACSITPRILVRGGHSVAPS